MKIFFWLLTRVIALTGMFFVSDKMAFAITSLPDQMLKCPVFITLDSGSAGSGFIFNNEKKIYLISAKHVFMKDENTLLAKGATFRAYSLAAGFQEQLDIKIDLELSMNEKRILFNKESDIVAIEIGTKQPSNEENNIAIQFNAGILVGGNMQTQPLFSVNEKFMKKYSDVIVSNDMFLLGYPSSLGTGDMSQLDISKPLVRKGIVAGLNDNLKRLILDCFSYPGNSGGPVIDIREKGLGSYEWNIIGVLIQYVPFVDEITLNRSGQVIGNRNSNSGYSIAEPMDKVLDLISEPVTIVK